MSVEGPFNINAFGTSQGWQCPICKRVYSPSTPMCFYCGNSSFENNITFAKVEQILNDTAQKLQKYKEQVVKINASREVESK